MKIKNNTVWRKIRSGRHHYTYFCIRSESGEHKLFNISDFEHDVPTGWWNLLFCEYVGTLSEYKKTKGKMINIGKEIKKARMHKKLTQKKLADLLDLPQSRIAEWETGKHTPSSQTIDRIEKALNVSFVVSFVES